jgi:hypothetical protein
MSDFKGRRFLTAIAMQATFAQSLAAARLTQ